MVADVTIDARLSRFTLAIFKDSGVYETDPKDAEVLEAGYKTGCAYFYSIMDTIISKKRDKRKHVKKRARNNRKYYKAKVNQKNRNRNRALYTRKNNYNWKHNNNWTHNNDFDFDIDFNELNDIIDEFIDHSHRADDRADNKADNDNDDKYVSNYNKFHSKVLIYLHV